MVASASCLKLQLFARINRAIWLWLSATLVLAYSVSINSALAFLSGCTVWWLGSYFFANRVCQLLLPARFQGLWAGIVKAEVLKLLVVASVLALIGINFPSQALWALGGYIAGQASIACQGKQRSGF